MDMKAVKEENAEEDDDDVPGRDANIALLYQCCFSVKYQLDLLSKV